jgi:hypothetical protein
MKSDFASGFTSKTESSDPIPSNNSELAYSRLGLKYLMFFPYDMGFFAFCIDFQVKVISDCKND